MANSFAHGSAAAHTDAHRAIFEGDTDGLVRVVVGADSGVHARFRRAYGDTMLNTAIRALRPDMVRLLARPLYNKLACAGVPTTAPLLVATRSRHGVDSIVQVLLLAGADVNGVGPDGRTPLHHAAFSNRQLADSGDPIVRDRRNGWGLPPASTKVSTAVVRALVDAGARVGARDNDGNTPLHAATARGWYDAAVVRCLVAVNADVNGRNDRGETPLHVACREQGTIHVVECLVQHGADTRAADRSGATPLDVARAYNNYLAEGVLSRIHDRTAKNSGGNNPSLTAWTELGGTSSLHFLARDR